MSLLVARMITPLIAAYFLKAHGVQPHAAGKTMDFYLGSQLEPRYDEGRCAAGAAAMPRASGYSRSRCSSCAGAVPRSPHGGWSGRLRRGFVAPGRLLFATLARIDDRVPAAAPDLDFSQRVRHSRDAAGLDAGAGRREQTEAVADRVAAIVEPRIPRSSACSSASTSATAAGQHRPQEGPQGHQHRVRAEPVAEAGGDPDARSTSRARTAAARTAAAGATSCCILGGDDPGAADSRSPTRSRRNGDRARAFARRASASLVAQPEITIKPRFDLAADLGVTTAALSQTIRIATLGDIEQNSAKFSLSDRQVPITVSLSENARRDIATLENLPVPTSSGGSVPLKAVAEIGFGAGPTTVQRSNQLRRIAIGADLAPGLVVKATCGKINELPTVKNLPQGVQKLNLGDQQVAGRAAVNFAIALIVGRAAGVRGAGAALPPLPRAVRQHGLAAARAAGRGDRAAHRPASRSRCRC
jgi:hypothetical protein